VGDSKTLKCDLDDPSHVAKRVKDELEKSDKLLGLCPNSFEGYHWVTLGRLGY
jgi:hypothetical protein